jgi:hypothetical protein
MIKNAFLKLSSFIRSRGLGFEICLIIALKIFLLWAIWWACFSHPISKETRQQAVTQILLTPLK